MAEDTAIEKRETGELQTAERMRAGRTYIPNVDILERDDQLLLMADMPGVKAEDLEIHYEHGELTVHGRVAPRPHADPGGYLLREYGVGDYYRAFQVGEGISADKIEAVLQDGVLSLHLPKSEAARPRRITVKTA